MLFNCIATIFHTLQWVLLFWHCPQDNVYDLIFFLCFGMDDDDDWQPNIHATQMEVKVVPCLNRSAALQIHRSKCSSSHQHWNGYRKIKQFHLLSRWIGHRYFNIKFIYFYLIWTFRSDALVMRDNRNRNSNSERSLAKDKNCDLFCFLKRFANITLRWPYFAHFTRNDNFYAFRMWMECWRKENEHLIDVNATTNSSANKLINSIAFDIILIYFHQFGQKQCDQVMNNYESVRGHVSEY